MTAVCWSRGFVVGGGKTESELKVKVLGFADEVDLGWIRRSVKSDKVWRLSMWKE